MVDLQSINKKFRNLHVIKYEITYFYERIPYYGSIGQAVLIK